MSKAEHITEIQDIKSLNTPRIFTGRVLASMYFTVNGCRTGWVKEGMGRGAKAFGAIPTCPFFSEKHWGEHEPS